MAVPTITVIYPNTGPTGGRRLVQIMGSNFQLPPDPPLVGPVPVPNPSVEVLFGGVAGTRVAVAATSRLFVLTPVSPLDASSPEGPVDVEVRNIDQDGVLIPGETVTATNGYTYARPDLNARPEPDIVRLVRALLQDMKRQLLGNISLEVHTDWSDAPATGLTFLSELPAVTLHGPDIRQNRFYSINEARSIDNTFGLGEEFFEELRPPMTVDLVFDLLGATDRKHQGISLQAEVVQYFNRNKYVCMLADGEDPTSDVLEWELDFEPIGLPVVVKGTNNSNVRAFRCRFVVRGFDLDDASMSVLITRQLEDQVSEGSVLEPSAVELEEVQQTGVSYMPGFSPGEG